MKDIFALFKQIESPAATLPLTHVIVGLGNPGATYENTRHNIGFAALDALCGEAGVRLDRAKFDALCGEGVLGGVRTLFLAPQTFMNLSGVAVRAALAFYKIPPERLLVLCDDINFAPGRLRLRLQGSHGGHNGLRNIAEQLGSDAYARLKIGVGQKPTPAYDLVDWVLGKLPAPDRDAIFARFSDITTAATRFLQGDAEGAIRACAG